MYDHTGLCRIAVTDDKNICTLLSVMVVTCNMVVTCIALEEVQYCEIYIFVS
jgi:hypothetical protein